MKTAILTSALLTAAACPAFAHVSVTPGHVDKAAYFVAEFRVGHGCAGAATTEIRVNIPDGIDTARPRAAEGWELEIRKTGERATQIIWRGGHVPDDQFEAFQVLMKAPDAGASLYFPITQICGDARSMWDQIPATGADGSGLSNPAPSIHVGPMNGGMDHAGHQH